MLKTNHTRTALKPAFINYILSIIRGNGQSVSTNIVYSFVIKGVSLLTSFAMVPMVLNYLGKQDYGIWLTLSSMIAWLSFFDVGFGNGLRNKLAESIAVNDKPLARIYVSTAYAGFSGLAFVLLASALIANRFIDWNELLNAPHNRNYDLNSLATILLILFSIRMVLKLVSFILIADRRTALGNVFDPIGGIISLAAIYFLTTTSSQSSLSTFIIVISIIPVMVLLIASSIIFNGRYKWIRPDILHVKKEYLKDLVNIGFKFFIIQISVLIIFSTDNLIIARILGPSEVTSYNIAYKYFSIATMLFSIIITPMWSAYTRAYTLNDTGWIRKSNNKIIMIWGLLSLMVIVMTFFSTEFYKLWIGNSIEIPLLLSIIMGLFVMISTWNNIFVYFINSTGKITFQLYASIIAALINIPLSIFLAREMELGASGVILATCICLFPGVIFGPLQFKKILNNTDKGIWSK
ncbi:MAG TPA: oligosaccharide flippase family protein [Lentimicrobium sp.]|nr:oligosaccharide flippase family protein [Lentimicrobium sp.]